MIKNCMKTYVKYLFIIVVVVLILLILSNFDSNSIALAEVKRDRWTGEKIYEGTGGDSFFEFLILAFIFFGGVSEIVLFIAVIIHKYTGIWII